MRGKKKTIRLGELQLRIMKVLWSAAEPVSVADVQQALDGEPLAYTTIATMLRKMEDRDLVRHREDGRKYLYEPVVTSGQASRFMADDFVHRMFEGSVTAAVNHLLETRDVNPDELAELERLIQRHKRKK
jgi:predicted transcriptional regulator